MSTQERVYRVCLPNTHRDYFDYQADTSPCIGARVWVPFRKHHKLGLVIAYCDEQLEPRPLKKIQQVLDEQPLLDSDLLALCLWIARYYQSPLSEVIALAIPKKYRLGKPCIVPQTDSYELACPLEEALARVAPRAIKQRALLHHLSEQQSAVNKTELSRQGFNNSQYLPLVELGILRITQQSKLLHTHKATPQNTLVLNQEQETAVATMSQHLHHYHCFLLHGVTGSGKTEVYLDLIQRVLLQGKQILVLVPEIGLTPQLVARFSARLQQPIAVIHSSLNETERQVAWQMAKEHKVSVVIGTRAAVFTPMPALGLIIIDEEHDASFKQMEGVRYSARDTALMRAHRAHVPIVLGSATPSLESLYNCQQNKYTMIRLHHKALSSQALHYQLIDLRAQPIHHGLASPTLEVIKTHLEQNNQVLVFINRRGFAPVLLCHQCGWMMDCKACDSHLTLHQRDGQMVCHHCGLSTKKPPRCQSCKSTELIPVGAGTQRVHEYLTSLFPNYAVARIDRDETRKKNALAHHLEQISSGAVQLIVGTQMLAKGHHFPRLSLVVILDADAGFYNQDFRATEQLGQLLTQVAGRAGRADTAGEVIIQTHLPQHPLLNLLIQKGYDAFAEALLTSRQEANLPPFHFLAVLRAQSKSLPAVTQLMRAAKRYMAHLSLTIMGPAPAPLPRKADQYRMQLLIKSPSRTSLTASLTQMRTWLNETHLSKGIRWNVDMDPIDLS